MSNVKEHVLSIIKTLETGIDCDGESIDTMDYINDILDVNYIINQDRTYKGVRLLVAFGGPNIWIDTSTKMVEGHWWSDKFEFSYREDALDLDNWFSEMWECN